MTNYTYTNLVLDALRILIFGVNQYYTTILIQKFLLYSLALVLFIFGVLQYNDPDFYLWFPLYLIVSLIPILYLHEYISSKIILLIALGYGIFLLTYIPAIVDWVSEGMASITKSMQAESPHIELVREFFGLVLCEIVLIVFYVKSKRRGR